jgi:hypothetical protein
MYVVAIQLDDDTTDYKACGCRNVVEEVLGLVVHHFSDQTLTDVGEQGGCRRAGRKPAAAL